jgi:transcriptional regulator with XRE-family HTH domain
LTASACGAILWSMGSPVRIQREAKELSDTLREALRLEVERSRVDLKELSARVGRADGYFSHLFKGRITLTTEHIFTVLLAIGVTPADFFKGLYVKDAKEGRSALEEDNFDERVLRAMERYGIKPRLRDDDAGAL